MSGIMFAMEEIENEVPANVEEAAETAVAVADETAEIQQENDEVGVTVAQVEDAVQAGDELESIGEVAEEAVESGEGLSEESAEMASIAIESIRNRLGFRDSTRLVPATESFGNVNTRLMSTKLVVETIGETIKKIWLRIKQIFARLWEKVKGFIAKLFNSATMLQKHVDGLLVKAKALPADLKPAKDKISSGAKAFSSEGKADLGTVQEIIKNADLFAAVASTIAAQHKTLSDYAQQLASKPFTEENVMDFMTKATGAANGFLKAASPMKTINANLASIVAPAGDGAKGITNFAYGPFVNSKVFNLASSEVEIFGKPTKSIYASFVNAKAEPAKEIEALKKDQIVDVLEQASALCKKLAAFKKVQSEYEAVAKASAKLADTVIASAGKVMEKTEAKKETNEGLKALRKEVATSMKGMQTIGSFGPSVVFSTIKAAADLASASMANLKGAESK